MALLSLALAFGTTIGRIEPKLAGASMSSPVSAPPYVAYGTPPQPYNQPTSRPSIPQRAPAQLAPGPLVVTSPQYSQFVHTPVQNYFPARPIVDVPLHAGLVNQYIPRVFPSADTLPAPAARQIDGDHIHQAKMVSLGPSATSTGTSTVPYHLRNMASPNNDELIPGEVFKLVTLSDDPEFDNETVVIYRDGTLGISEPDGPGYLFQGLLLSEYGLLFTPEPLRTVKFTNQKVFFLNESLYNPTPVFVADKWTLLINGGQAAICPSWNSVLVLVSDSESAPCADWVNVKLHIVPLSI